MTLNRSATRQHTINIKWDDGHGSMVPQAKKTKECPVQSNPAEIWGASPRNANNETCRIRPKEFQKRSKTHSLEPPKSAWEFSDVGRKRAERPPIRWGRSLDVAVKPRGQQKTLGPERPALCPTERPEIPPCTMEPKTVRQRLRIPSGGSQT